MSNVLEDCTLTMKRAELMKKMIFILLLVISVTCSVCETFQLSCAQRSYQGFKNEDVTLEWTFTESSLDSLHIYCFAIIDLKHQALLEYDKGVQNPLDGPFRGRVQWDKDVLRERRIRLHVSSLRTEDSGDYECQVKTREGSDWAQCGITVKETFEVRSAQSFYQVFKNEDVTLEWTFTKSSLNSLVIFCYVITDLNKPTLLDYSNGRQSNIDGPFEGRVQWDKSLLKDGRIRLNVSSLRTEESSLYRCDVKTSEGFGWASCNVTVKDKLQTTPETKTVIKDGKTWTGEWIGLSIVTFVLLVCFVLWCFWKEKHNLVSRFKKITGVNSAGRILCKAVQVENV